LSDLHVTSKASPGNWKQGAGPRGCHPPAVHHRRIYKYTVEEELLEHSPAAHVRRPRVDYESHAAALDRNELGALLVAAGLRPPIEHALISLLALNGMRVSEATGAGIEHLDLERGHRTLTITRKGGKVVTIPLAPHTARAIDLVIGERTSAPVFLAADGAAAGPARHLHRRRPRRRRRPVTGAPAGKAPPDDLNRRTELPAAADPEHPAVTLRDLSANANRLSGRLAAPRRSPVEPRRLGRSARLDRIRRIANAWSIRRGAKVARCWPSSPCRALSERRASCRGVQKSRDAPQKGARGCPGYAPGLGEAPGAIPVT
jgi:hypothetical protein